MKNRPLTAADNIGKVCGCASCVDAGVATEPMRRVPDGHGGSKWLHAHELRDWLTAYRDLRAKFGQAITEQGLDPKKLKRAMEGPR